MGGGGKGGGSSGGDQQVVTQKSEPWSAQQPYLTEIFKKAQENYNSANPSYYPGSTLAPQSADTLAGMNSARAAIGNTDILNTAQSTANATARGDYLDPSTNPWLEKTYQAAADPVMRNFQTAVAPSIDGGAVAAGRYGSGAWANAQRGAQDSLGTSLSNLATGIYGGNYQTERDRQMGAVNNAASTYGLGFMPSTALQGLGGLQDARAQDVINADIQKYNYNQNLPQAKLADYLAMIQGSYGGSQTTTQPVYNSNSAGMLGGLLSLGGGLLGSYFGGPMGGMAGSSLGGMAGRALGN